MLLKYESRIRLLAGHFTCKDFLAPYGILDVFQDVAGDHARGAGLGYDDLIKNKIIWILITNKYKVIKNPEFYSNVIVETWPKRKNKVDFYREYRIRDLEGNDLVHGFSRWVIANVETRKIIIPRDFEYEGEFFEETNFPGKFEKMRDFEVEGMEKYQAKMNFTDLDHNLHVNNVRYTYHILDAIKEPVIKEFEITYVNEAKLGDIINIYYKKDGDTYQVKGTFENNETCFLCCLKV